jgi:signal transduction histidine kinase
VEDSSLPGRLEAAIEALRKCEGKSMAGQLALEVMHEIRNPLEALGNFVYLALRSSDLETTREYMREATEQITTLYQIAGQSLTLARNKQTATVNLAELTEAALRVHHRRVTIKSIRVIRDVADTTIVKVATGEILQVISNLIGNALDALPDRGIISLRIRKRSNQISLVVADSGHGISADNLERLFERFFTTKNDRGNGLGLALSKKIIERHGGTIRARSSIRPGRSGTTFRILLPV